MKITFKLLQQLSEADDDVFINVLNSFKGENIHDKFVEILKVWERDVSYDLTLNVGGKNVKLMMSYIIKEFQNFENESIIVGNDLKLVVNTPTTFTPPTDQIFPYDIIHKISMGDKELACGDDMDVTINKIPAKFYNLVLDVVENGKKTVVFSNPSLSTLKINFLTWEPYLFLKSLFTPFGQDYFRDIIYHLSKKIDGNLLMKSTIFDIEYYIDKMNSENKEADVPNLG